MGVSCMLFVLAPHSSYGSGFVSYTFRLRTDKDLVGPLEALVEKHKHVKWPNIQLPAGSWSTFSGGETPWPEEYNDCERGWLQDDCYGNEFWAFKGKHLTELKREEDGAFPDWDDSFNRTIFEFIVKMFPEHDVVVFFD